FYYGGAWPTIGVSLMVGRISAIYGLLISDATTHIFEEVKDAGPSALITIAWGYFGNGFLAIIVLPAYYSQSHRFQHRSPEVPVSIPICFPENFFFSRIMFSNILFNESTARQTHAFARWISNVHPHRRFPVRTNGLSCLTRGCHEYSIHCKRDVP
ncbi:hypothetical protein N7520_005359, partial [Penicillium odoratum]|uniref:uncharacterized protein n=1 Tax=Penicillium odoratum TaxID=1167516 RepID=UPI00254921C0